MSCPAARRRCPWAGWVQLPHHDLARGYWSHLVAKAVPLAHPPPSHPLAVLPLLDVAHLAPTRLASAWLALCAASHPPARPPATRPQADGRAQPNSTRCHWRRPKLAFPAAFPVTTSKR
eukprot:3850837-Pyramimonas_sp.AAC.3